MLYRTFLRKRALILNIYEGPRPEFGPQNPEDTQKAEKLVMEFDREATDQYIFRLNVYKNNDFKDKYFLPQFPLIMEFKQYVNLGVEVLTNMARDPGFIFSESNDETKVYQYVRGLYFKV